MAYAILDLEVYNSDYSKSDCLRFTNPKIIIINEEININARKKNRKYKINVGENREKIMKVYK